MVLDIQGTTMMHPDLDHQNVKHVHLGHIHSAEVCQTLCFHLHPTSEVYQLRLSRFIKYAYQEGLKALQYLLPQSALVIPVSDE